MKNFIFKIYLFTLALGSAFVCSTTLESCSKHSSEIENIVSDDSGYVDSSFVFVAKPVTDYSENFNTWESLLTREQFNVICEYYTGEKNPSELYALSTGKYYLSREVLSINENTQLKRGSKKRIYSTPEITEYILANLGQPVEIDGSVNFYSIGSSFNKLTWQDATNSVFAENLNPITDFNPELINWDSALFFSGCTYQIEYPYPVTIENTDGSFSTIPAPGNVFLHATCNNETTDEGTPILPLFDYWVEVPGLGWNNKIYIIQ